MSALPDRPLPAGCPDAERLSRLLDGELPPEEASACEGHLQGCPECARVHAELSALRAGLGRLGSLPPPPELFDRVAAAVDRHRRRRLLVGTGAVGALGAVALAVGLLVASRVALSVDPPPAAPPTVRDSAEAEFRKAEIHYRNAIDMLEALVAEEKPRWSWQRQAAYEADVKVLKRAIAQSRTLARRAPEDPALQDLIFSAYRAQLDYLRDVLSPRTDDAL